MNIFYNHNKNIKNSPQSTKSNGTKQFCRSQIKSSSLQADTFCPTNSMNHQNKNTPTFMGSSDFFTKSANIGKKEKASSEIQKIKIKPLTAEEFQAKKAELMQTAKELESLKNINENRINEHNIFVLEAIVKNPELMNNKNFADKVGDIIAYSSSAEIAKARIDLMDKILATPELMNNKNFADNVGDIISNSSSAESAKAKIDVMDAILARPELMNNKNFADNVGDIISNSDSAERASVALKICENPEIMNNKNFADKVGGIIFYSDSAERAKAKIDVMDAILARPELMNNKNFADNVGDIIRFSSSAEIAKVEIEIMEYINEKYIKSRFIRKS